MAAALAACGDVPAPPLSEYSEKQMADELASRGWLVRCDSVAVQGGEAECVATVLVQLTPAQREGRAAARQAGTAEDSVVGERGRHAP